MGVSECPTFIPNSTGTNADGTITNSYSSGSVSGSYCVGGLVGYNTRTITNSYSSGSVSGSYCVGGLVGYYSGGTITNSYSSGSVSGTSDVGGLVGYIAMATTTNSYYDTNTSGQSDTGKGDPKTTTEMKQQATFSGWDFDTVWAIVEHVTYPYLRWQYAPNITSFAPPSPVNDTVCTWRTFNVTVNQTVNVSWYLNKSLLDTNVSTKEANYTLHAEFVGDNNVSAVAENANGTDMQTWVWNVTSPRPEISINKTASISGTCPDSDPLTVHIGDTVTYCFNVTNTGDVNLTNVAVVDNIHGPVWLANDRLDPGESTEGTLTHVVVEFDAPSVTNIATATGIDPLWDIVTDTDSCTINVAIPPNITSFAHPSHVNDTVCNWRAFNVTVNQTANVSRYLDNSLLHTNQTVTEANYTLHAEFVGDNSVSAKAENANGTDMQTWVWNVTGAEPPIPVPVFNIFGLLALIGILSVTLAVATLRKRK